MVVQNRIHDSVTINMNPQHHSFSPLQQRFVNIQEVDKILRHEENLNESAVLVWLFTFSKYVLGYRYIVDSSESQLVIPIECFVAKGFIYYFITNKFRNVPLATEFNLLHSSNFTIPICSHYDTGYKSIMFLVKLFLKHTSIFFFFKFQFQNFGLLSPSAH